MSEPQEAVKLPVVPIRNAVLFPYLLMPLSIGRPGTVASVEAAMVRGQKHILVVAQRDPSISEPGEHDLFTIGTRAVIKGLGRRGGTDIEVVAQGIDRVIIEKLEQQDGSYEATVRPLPPPQDAGDEVEALHRAVLDLLQKAFAFEEAQPVPEMARLMLGQDDPTRLVYLLGSMLSIDVAKEQALLEAPTRLEGLRLVHSYLSHEVRILELRNKITSEAQTEISKEQREYVLRQQMRAIQQELGAQNAETAEVEQLRARFAEADLPEAVRTESERELKRLEKLPSASPDYHVIRSYLDLVLELPWKKRTREQIDIAYAREVLEHDHYGLKDVKERILEQLGVLKINPGAKAPILCFVGPPGVGKTSLGQSIARAMDRKFERMSLGGLHDEAELRGHRRTYIGALPGRIIQAIRRAGVNNPLLMLDEVDKLGQDFRGDPASALLEILDPEQNRNFRDNYLDLPFDLSNVFFITTANGFDTIPRPLLDRMEVLRLPGYSEEEKIEIAKRYLAPRQLRETGLSSGNLAFNEDALRSIVERYTREAGVRQLERTIGRVARKVALRFAEGDAEPVSVSPDDLAELLGPEMFFAEHARKDLPPGVATGVAWTETGGDVLYIEAALLPGGRGLILTGNLGEVMQESARAAHSYIWSRCEELHIDRKRFQREGIHVHVPAGAMAKDGPSAGVTMATALTSLFTGYRVRCDTAMTGEITLTGVVLPIGGVKEKVLAARRAGLKRFIMPEHNRKDLVELSEDVRASMEFIFVERIEDVLAAAIPDLKPATVAAPA